MQFPSRKMQVSVGQSKKIQQQLGIKPAVNTQYPYIRITEEGKLGFAASQERFESWSEQSATADQYIKEVTGLLKKEG